MVDVDDGYSVEGDSTAPVAVWTPVKRHSKNERVSAG
jgi:hypothetical protein